MPRDAAWIPAGVKHWHGADPATAMTHIAIQEARDGNVVTWLEHRERPAVRHHAALTGKVRAPLHLGGTINSGKVFDQTLPLEQVAEGYRAMDERRAIKTLLMP